MKRSFLNITNGPERATILTGMLQAEGYFNNNDIPAPIWKTNLIKTVNRSIVVVNVRL